MPCWTSQPWPHNFNRRASGKPGAVQSDQPPSSARVPAHYGIYRTPRSYAPSGARMIAFDNVPASVTMAFMKTGP